VGDGEGCSVAGAEGVGTEDAERTTLSTGGLGVGVALVDAGVTSGEAEGEGDGDAVNVLLPDSSA